MALRVIDSVGHLAYSDIGTKWFGGTFNADSVVTGPYGSPNKAIDFGPGTQATSGEIAFGTADTDIYFGLTFKLDSLSSAKPIAQFITNDSNPGFGQVAIGANTSGAIEVHRGHNVGTLIASSATGLVSAGNWYELHGHIVFSNTVGVVTLKLGSFSGTTAPTGFSTIIDVSSVDTINRDFDPAVGVIHFGQEAESGSQTDTKVGNIWVADTTGSRWNSFPSGAVRVDSLFADSAGALSAWTPNTGTNVGAIDDATPDGDTTYVSTSSASTIDTYGFSALGLDGSILAIQHVIYAKRTGGSGTVRPITRVGSTNYAGSSHTLTTSYDYYLQVAETNPATSAVWTRSALEAAEFGQELTAGDARVSQRLLEVVAAGASSIQIGPGVW